MRGVVRAGFEGRGDTPELEKAICLYLWFWHFVPVSTSRAVLYLAGVGGASERDTF